MNLILDLQEGCLKENIEIETYKGLHSYDCNVKDCFYTVYEGKKMFTVLWSSSNKPVRFPLASFTVRGEKLGSPRKKKNDLLF